MTVGLSRLTYSFMPERFVCQSKRLKKVRPTYNTDNPFPIDDRKAFDSVLIE